MLCGMARIAIIGGGSIGEALLAGLLRAGRQVKDLVVAEKNPTRAQYLSDKYSVLVTSVPDAVDAATYVVVAVKPADVQNLIGDIADTAERGPGSAAEYVVDYDGARLVITVLTWSLDLDRLAATAERCATYKTFFDASDPGIPMTTTRLDTPRPQALVYEQTMHLAGAERSVFFSFENVGSMAVFGIAFPTPDPTIDVKATLPQTFLEVMAKQADKAAQAA